MDIATKSFNAALNTLKALGASFVIISKDGEKHTNGNVDGKIRKRMYTFPRGTYTDYLKEKGFTEMKVGEVMTIDPSAFPPESLRANASSYSTRLWGAGSATTTIHNGKLEILRIM